MSETNTLGTKDKLLLAAIDLMSEKGYAATTTKEIALGAGVNEVTLFRHFGTKEKLVEAAFSRFHYADEMTKLFRESLQGELHGDLLLISRTYHKLMNRNRKLFMIIQRGKSQLPEEVYQEAARHPQQLKKLLTDYLAGMASQGKVLPSANPEVQALSFMWMNHGAFNSNLLTVELDVFIEESVRMFARALTP
ncbi:TetR/AcrR family transcriptional regulator [Paenibacillus sp. LHD-117]|uniref:TetR/AcrR family transcriptional regulator n=1 Tax=Paenibacillus sp. LHD-117 TaxID=3071412 RepID=UPI0027E04824|nr:TetR/AcrR family transcriptional regulator [Paenibacillus sp. LHD-117]MDQ6420058.1 TetR/AcrR family transcriptional regulator [Paenibacillus sp. LHD-117]